MLGPCRTAREIYWFGTAPSGHPGLNVHWGSAQPRRRALPAAAPRPRRSWVATAAAG